MPRYEFSEGSSNKFWEIELTGSSFTTTYGKIGASGQTTLKSFKDDAAAKKEYDKIVAEKVKKGYALVGGGAPAAVVAAAPAPAPQAAKPISSAAQASSAPAAAAKPAAAPGAAVSAAMAEGKVRYELVEGSSNKFWEISLDGESFSTTYGKIGTSGQSTTKDFDDEAQAQDAYDKIVAEKVKTGYKLVSGGPPVGKSNPELEAKILENPDDAAAYLVYADWLQAQGDPRGELIVVQHSLATKPESKASLTASEKKLFADHAAQLLGPLAKDKERFEDVHWQYGFLKSVKVGVDYDAFESGVRLARLIKALVEHPSARFLQELTFGPDSNDDGETNYEKSLEALVKARPQALRSLFAAEFDSEDCELSWSHLGKVSGLYSACPKLRKLILRAGTMTLGEISLPELLEFAVRTGGLEKANIKSIGAAHWPRLERLEIWFGTSNYGGDGTIKDVAPILAATNLPSVKHLGLMNCEFTDDICKALPASKVLKQLETLDLSMGCMTAAGVDALLASRDAFRHLKKLDVSDNAIAEGAEKKLATLCSEVVAGGQSPDRVRDDYRYTSVGE
jgi:uncharacterized protein (TIGR02996 family)